jgi:hypothetical protein
VSTYSINASRASWPIFSISSLLLRGLIVLASPSSYSSSFNSTCALSRGIMMVPLDFRLPSFGLWSLVVSGLAPSSLTEPEEDEEELMSSLSEADEGHTAGSATVGKPDEAICCMDMAGREGCQGPVVSIAAARWRWAHLKVWRVGCAKVLERALSN